jgi:hypothetical protein
MRRNALLEDFALQGLLLTLQTDGATITRRPLTNYVTQIPNKGPLHLAYDDSSEIYHSGGSKDATTVFEGIDNVLNEFGPRDFMHLVTDCAPVMTSACELVEITHPHIFTSGCISHQVNTLVKHCCEIAYVKALIKKCQSLTHKTVKYIID